MSLKFNFCNENLNSIIAGLEPCKNDIILAIGGSGDQALALLEYGCKVVVVDYSQDQISYIKEVIQKIKNNDFQSFINIENCDRISQIIKKKAGIDMFEQRSNYFNNIERFEKIQLNIDNLIIIDFAQSIFQFLENTDMNFSKIYLSNIFTTMSNYKKDGSKGEYDFSEFSNSLQTLCSKLYEGGLLYFADGDIIRERLKSNKFNSLFQQRFSLKHITLKVDKNKTKKAREKQSFPGRIPLVLKLI